MNLVDGEQSFKMGQNKHMQVQGASSPYPRESRLSEVSQLETGRGEGTIRACTKTNLDDNVYLAVVYQTFKMRPHDNDNVFFV